MDTRLKLRLVAGTAFALAGSVAAQQGTPGAVPASDKNFMVKAAQGGMGEVLLGRLAQAHAGRAGVKQFGKRMVTDHTKANTELMHVAAKQGVTLPTGPGAEEQAAKARLARLSGTAFDKAYVSDMVEDHEKDVADFKNEAATGKDPAVKALAAKTLPMLQMHLQMAQTLHSEMKRK